MVPEQRKAGAIGWLASHAPEGLKHRVGDFIRWSIRHTPLWIRFRRVKYGVEVRPWYRILLRRLQLK